MDEKFWQDYTKFIKLSEETTGLSPSDLLERYKVLVEELEKHDEDQLEWLYEEMEEHETFQKIHELLHLKQLMGNLLKDQFENEIASLDGRMKLFLKENLQNNPNWKENFTPDDLNV